MIKSYIIPIEQDGPLGRTMEVRNKSWVSNFPENTGNRLFIQIRGDNERVSFITSFRGNEVLWEICIESDSSLRFFIRAFCELDFDKFFDWMLQNLPIEHNFLMFNLDILNGHFTPPDDLKLIG